MKVVPRSWTAGELYLTVMCRYSLGNISPPDVSQCMMVLWEQANHYTIDRKRLDLKRAFSHINRLQIQIILD